MLTSTCEIRIGSAYLHHIPGIPFQFCLSSLLKLVCYNRVANHREIQWVLSFPRGTDYACTMRKGPGHSLWHCRDTSLAEEPLCIFSQHNVLPMPLLISSLVLDVTLGLVFVILFSVILFGHLTIISKGWRLETKIEIFTPSPKKCMYSYAIHAFSARLFVFILYTIKTLVCTITAQIQNASSEKWNMTGWRACLPSGTEIFWSPGRANFS